MKGNAVHEQQNRKGNESSAEEGNHQDRGRNCSDPEWGKSLRTVRTFNEGKGGEYPGSRGEEKTMKTKRAQHTKKRKEQHENEHSTKKANMKNSTKTS